MRVFVTGATGHMGRALIPVLNARGHDVTALVRPGSESKAPDGCSVLPGNPLDPVSFTTRMPDCDTLVHLVGTAHPSPWKGQQFRDIDQASLNASVTAARIRGIPHLVYVSVAQPALIMRAYIQVRAECEQTIRDAGLNASILRPWYVLGPGRRWPAVLIPLYKLFEVIPTTREGAVRLGLVTMEQMISALVWSVENPPTGVRITGVPGMRSIPPLSRTSRGTATPGRSATHG